MNHQRFRAACLLLALALALLPARMARANTYTVTNTNDSGAGSLRRAINQANGNPGPDTITFSIPGAGVVHTITPLTALPVLTDSGTTIDGYTQPGATPAIGMTPAVILIEINGTNVTVNNGLNILSAGNTVRGLAINRFGYNGIAIGGSTATSNTISGNYIGTDASGTTDRGNGLSGVFIGLGARNNTVGGAAVAQRNALSGNGWEGVGVHGVGTAGNVVSGNYIGVAADGTTALGNDLYGVRIYGGAQNNTIGGDVIGEQNVISSNGRDGIRIAGANTTGNVVAGNYIGTNFTGTLARGNFYGVCIIDGAQRNTIGGDTADERNLISDNAVGVVISGTNTTTNTVRNNYIGTTVDGMFALTNTMGIEVLDGARDNVIGPDNLISGNGKAGVHIGDPGTAGNVVVGNRIGTNAAGTAALGNVGYGVVIADGASDNRVGGSMDDDRNVISGNGMIGVGIVDSGSTGNVVLGNYIGTNANGTGDLGNSDDGIYVGNGASGNTIGPGNVIAGNDRYGVYIRSVGTTGNTVAGNYIGLTATGLVGLGNADSGVYIGDGARDNIIGGDATDERNVISANDYGIWIEGSGTTGNVVAGNYIGLAADGVPASGNMHDGVRISIGAQNNTIGAGNVIAYNGEDGVAVDTPTAYDNVITQNSIFANGGLGIDLTNGANGGVTAPVIAATTPGSIHIAGTACAGCTVEVFASGDTDGEGQTYLGSATATAGGAFTVTVTALPQPYLTATATDAISGTSEFSAAFTSTIRTIFLPIIRKES